MATDAKKLPPPVKSVRLPADLMRMAKQVAGATGETVAAVVGDAARPTIVKRHRAVVAKLAAEHAGGLT
jgi:hypothetical protein